jgi:hypothetical protein
MATNEHTPGPGWTRAGIAPVYDHVSGVRVHVTGLCRLASGEMIWGRRWPECQILDRMIRINGGNRKRGAMAWSLAKAQESPRPNRSVRWQRTKPKRRPIR